ncbi:hypothetical protein [Arsenicicoccus piscis]|uniref:hypothetical protein n=1 Tax=Arsenicicoccus piscis TaxID=673954 RepID=UPI0024E0CB72|nr:hypothetical protein [Arsenicicoccus piscis]
MTDIRLLIPAVAAWAAVALLLDQSVVGVAIAVAGVLLAAAGTLVVARRRQRPRRWWLLVPSPSRARGSSPWSASRWHSVRCSCTGGSGRPAPSESSPTSAPS